MNASHAKQNVTVALDKIRQGTIELMAALQVLVEMPEHPLGEQGPVIEDVLAAYYDACTLADMEPLGCYSIVKEAMRADKMKTEPPKPTEPSLQHKANTNFYGGW